jgi:hypothetical protein
MLAGHYTQDAQAVKSGVYQAFISTYTFGGFEGGEAART